MPRGSHQESRRSRQQGFSVLASTRIAQRLVERQRDRWRVNRIIRARLEREVARLQGQHNGLELYRRTMTSTILPSIKNELVRERRQYPRQELDVEFRKRFRMFGAMQRESAEIARAISHYNWLIYHPDNDDLRRQVPVEWYDGVGYITRRFRRMSLFENRFLPQTRNVGSSPTVPTAGNTESNAVVENLAQFIQQLSQPGQTLDANSVSSVIAGFMLRDQ